MRLSRNAAKKEQQIKDYIFQVKRELADSQEYDEKDILPSYTKYLKAFEMNKSSKYDTQINHLFLIGISFLNSV